MHVILLSLFCASIWGHEKEKSKGTIPFVFSKHSVIKAKQVTAVLKATASTPSEIKETSKDNKWGGALAKIFHEHTACEFSSVCTSTKGYRG